MRPSLLLPLVCLALFFASCTGLSLRESEPGGDTWLESGRIGVDPLTDTSFVMRRSVGGDKTVWAVPSDGDPAPLLDATLLDDVRILFPEAGILVMGERNERDRLFLYDRASRSEIGRHNAGVRYHGTRMSPSRRWVGVADNTSNRAPIHLIDASTFRTEIIRHGGEWLELNWLKTRDAFAAIVFYDQSTEDARARLLIYSIGALEDASFGEDEEGLWLAHELDVTVPGVLGDSLFSFTWVGVAPDDSQIVFPVRALPEVEGGPRAYRLLVLDPVTEEVRHVDDARGPVGFTPDGSTIVSYRYRDGEPSLLMIDAETLDEEELPLPTIAFGPEYFISHEGNFVVIASAVGGSQLILYDVDNDEASELEGPEIQLFDFVRRPNEPEVWIVDQGLYRVDFFEAELETVEIDFLPSAINLLPISDRLVLADEANGDLVFFDPEGRSITRRVPLH